MRPHLGKRHLRPFPDADARLALPLAGARSANRTSCSCTAKPLVQTAFSQNLLADDSGLPLRHPELNDFFVEDEDGRLHAVFMQPN